MLHALRRLRQDPGLALLVILTLALGVGVNSALFSLMNGLHRPLPVRDADRLVALATRHKDGGTGLEGMQYQFSYPALADFRTQSQSYTGLLAFSLGHGGLSTGDKAEEFTFTYVTGNYFSVLGIRPAVGRLFAPGEGESPGSAIPLVLGHSYWQKRFGGDPAVVGRQVRINGAAATVVGVVERSFQGTYANVDMPGYAPLSLLAQTLAARGGGFFHDRAQARLTVMGMLKPGARVEDARTEAQVIAGRLERQYPATDKDITVTVIPETWARPAPIPALVAMGPVVVGLFLVLGALVLALACLNVGNVLLVRAASRQQELAVRAALGSGRARLAGLILGEIILLAAAGGAAGVILSLWATDAAATAPMGLGNLPAALDFSPDWRVFAYALAATLLAAVAAGLWPALVASRADVASVLRGCGRSASAGRGGSRLRRFMIVAQVAGSLTLLIVAGCFAGGLAGARRIETGFEPRRLAVFATDTAYAGYSRERSESFYRELERRVRDLPGVEAAAAGYSMPLSYVQDADNVEAEGRAPAGARGPHVLLNSISPGYFETMRIALLAGRGFRESDRAGAPRVAVVNQLMARRLWPGENPMGKRFRIGRTGNEWWEVVGVAREGKYFALFEPPLPFFYVPQAQFFTSRRVLSVRSGLAPEELIARVEGEIRALDPELPVSEARMMEDAIVGATGLWGFRLGAILSGALGMLGLLLALVGVYGVVSYAARQSTREIGIRIALGAGKGDVLRLVTEQGAVLVAWGVAGGLAGAWVLARLISRSVPAAISSNLAVFAAAAALVAAAALWACYMPARRAASMDPMAALREE